jgi:Domain of unknown function (DUF4349)
VRRLTIRRRVPIAIVAALAGVTLLFGACGRSSAPRAAATAKEEKVGFVERRSRETDFSGRAAPPLAPTPAMTAPVVTGADAAAPGFTVLSGTADSAQVTAQSPSLGTPTTPMLIRTGAASVEVDSVEQAIQRVRVMAEKVGAYIANTSFAGGREQVRSATLELKVPAARFDELLNSLTPLGRVETVNVTAEDVGEEFVDVAAREANARRLEARLVTLLEQRAGRLSDVLAVERELARVREEIERYDGRMRYLRTHAAVSTLSLTVHQPPPLIGPTPVTDPIAEAFRQAWRNFIGAVAWVIAASGVLIPAAGLVALLAFALRPMRQRARGARPGPPDVADATAGR